MSRNADSTRERILDAATAEFAAHGAAGARVDRIAGAARANKERIYAYHGNKQALFAAVLEAELARYHDEVPFDPEALPAFAVATHDFFTRHPELARLAMWRSLEAHDGGPRIEVLTSLWRERIRAVADAQRRGTVAADPPAPELLALVFALARAWVVATPEAKRAAGVGRARQREAVRLAVTRLVEPRG